MCVCVSVCRRPLYADVPCVSVCRQPLLAAEFGRDSASVGSPDGPPPPAVTLTAQRGEEGAAGRPPPPLLPYTGSPQNGHAHFYMAGLGAESAGSLGRYRAPRRAGRVFSQSRSMWLNLHPGSG